MIKTHWNDSYLSYLKTECEFSWIDKDDDYRGKVQIYMHQVCDTQSFPEFQSNGTNGKVQKFRVDMVTF